MKKLQDWYLDSFLPKFMGIAMIVGVLAIVGLVSWMLEYYLKLNFEFLFFGILILCVLAYQSAKDSRLSKRIDDLLEDETHAIHNIIHEGNKINYTVLDPLIRKIAAKLHFEEFGEMEDMMKEVKKSVWVKYQKQNKK